MVRQTAETRACTVASRPGAKSLCEEGSKHARDVILSVNARTPCPKPVSLTLELESSRLPCSRLATPNGMRRDTPRVFEPFFTTKALAPGSAGDPASARSAVCGHRRSQRAPGGATFVLRLPLHEGEPLRPPSVRPDPAIRLFTVERCSSRTTPGATHRGRMLESAGFE